MSEILQQTLSLPCGAVLPNRLCKASMTEGLADAAGVPTEPLARLYGLWSDGGAGLLLSGNILIDGDHLERPGNVILEKPADDAMHAALAHWAQSATRNGNHFWAQLSHAGRQTQVQVNPKPKAPSAIKVGLPGGQFGEPQALTIAEIEELVQRFARAAKTVIAAGFTGVQIHAAHGYLISQFLSPRTNQRDDAYGGDLKARAKLLLDIVAAVRAAVGLSVPVAVKLNSADFQKGGFEFSDSLQVAQWLESASVDLIEVSGGTYEQPKLLGVEGLEATEDVDPALLVQGEPQQAESTRQREAYFAEFSLAMQTRVKIPLMVTGGMRQRVVMEEVITSGSAEMIGLGRPLCVQHDAPQQLLTGAESLSRFEDDLALLPQWLSFLLRVDSIRFVAVSAVQYWYYAQIDHLAHTGETRLKQTVFQAAKQVMAQQKRWLKERRVLKASRS